jgi:hypothetical protein
MTFMVTFAKKIVRVQRAEPKWLVIVVIFSPEKLLMGSNNSVVLVYPLFSTYIFRYYYPRLLLRH